MALSSDNKLLVAGKYDGVLELWDVGTGELIKYFHAPNLVSTHMTTGRSDVAHENCVCSVAISADNKLIISASGDRTMKIWDVATGKLINTIHGHQHGVERVILG